MVESVLEPSSPFPEELSLLPLKSMNDRVKVHESVYHAFQQDPSDHQDICPKPGFQGLSWVLISDHSSMPPGSLHELLPDSSFLGSDPGFSFSQRNRYERIPTSVLPHGLLQSTVTQKIKTNVHVSCFFWGGEGYVYGFYSCLCSLFNCLFVLVRMGLGTSVPLGSNVSYFTIS